MMVGNHRYSREPNWIFPTTWARAVFRRGAYGERTSEPVVSLASGSSVALERQERLRTLLERRQALLTEKLARDVERISR